MKKLLHVFGAVFLSLSMSQSAIAGSMCQGHFVNPITDICWECLFPISIGKAKIVPSSLPDTDNPANPVCICKTSTLPRIGIALGYWEPFALEDVTKNPMCMVNIGGVSLPIAGLSNQMGGDAYSPGNNSVGNGAFYEVHWYKYPLIFWLNILTNLGCMENSGFDVAYLTEFDPTWNDDALGFVLNPEAALFGNPVAQASCIADAVQATATKANNTLFWCMGAQGSSYPLTGNIANKVSNVSASVLEGERLNFKLHREALLWDTNSKNGLCQSLPAPILPKDRYRYQMVNTVPAANSCYPYGHSTMLWETGHDNPANKGNYGYLVWRKRNCCFM